MSAHDQHLIDFLRQNLGIPLNSIEVGLRHCQETTDPLPMVLWQYGLVSLQELEQIFDWLE